MNKISLLLFLFSVFISSVSQIILKTSANEEHKSAMAEYLNIKVILAYAIFFASSLITILAYKGVPLSIGPMLEATGYVWVAILSRIFLKEKISKRKLIGLITIIVGIIIASLF